MDGEAVAQIWVLLTVQKENSHSLQSTPMHADTHQLKVIPQTVYVDSSNAVIMLLTSY